MLRPIIASSVLGAVVGSVLAAGVLLARADETPGAITIDNFSFTPATLTVKAGTTVTWINRDDIPHGIGSANNAFKRSQALDTDDSYSFTFATPGTYALLLLRPSVYERHDRGGSSIRVSHEQSELAKRYPISLISPAVCTISSAVLQSEPNAIRSA
jgi:plastocyanin